MESQKEDHQQQYADLEKRFLELEETKDQLKKEFESLQTEKIKLELEFQALQVELHTKSLQSTQQNQQVVYEKDQELTALKKTLESEMKRLQLQRDQQVEQTQAIEKQVGCCILPPS